jgi:phosphatidylinositol phospholipase C beta
MLLSWGIIKGSLTAATWMCMHRPSIITMMRSCHVHRGAKKKPYLTAEQFVEFINSTQRDRRLNEILYPYCDVRRAQALIDQFEPNHNMASKGKH